MGKKIKWLIFTIPIVIMSIGLINYFLHFHKGLSSDAKDWGAFGSYINPFVTFTNVSLFIIFSLLVYRFNRSINTPFLTFKTEVINGREIWQIKNLGNGPAMNLFISYKLAGHQNWNSPAVKSYSLGKDDKVDLDWLQGSVDIIGVHYKDVLGDEFVAMVGDDITEIRNYRRFKIIEIGGNRFNKSEFDKLLQLDSVRINRMRKKMSEAKSMENKAPSTIAETTKLP